MTKQQCWTLLFYHWSSKGRVGYSTHGIGIQSADVDETVFLVVDPHFGVIDDAGYDPVCVCVACVRDYVNIQ